jgi:hypothetical protein
MRLSTLNWNSMAYLKGVSSVETRTRQCIVTDPFCPRIIPLFLSIVKGCPPESILLTERKILASSP